MILVYVAVAWLVGIALAETVDLPWQVWPVLGLAAFLALLLSRADAGDRGRDQVRLGALCTLTLVLGAGRFLLAVPHFDETSLATYNDVGSVILEGVVAAEPDERGVYTNLRVRAERLTLSGGTELQVDGLVLVKADRFPRRQYGDRVLVSGMLETPPVEDDFSYREYLARQGIYSLVQRADVTLLAERQGNPLFRCLLAFKRRAQSVIGSILPEPQAALLTGILLGVESGIPAGLMADFSATGTTHIIAISGFNITIVSGIFAGLARRLFGQRRAVWVALVGIAVYTVLVGASAAVLRAALMGALYLWGQHLGRGTFAPVSLAAAAIGMTLWNPYALWDVGFQLSFAATAGLVLYTEPLERVFERALGHFTSAERAQEIVATISEAVICTTAAQITTLPVILAYFGRLSIVTFLTNFLILPVQSYVMVVGGLALLLGLIIRPLGQMVGWVAWVFLTYTIEMVRLTAHVPHASVPLRVEGWMVWGYYALLGGLTWWLAQPKERRRELQERLSIPTRVLIGTAVILSLLVFFAWRSLPDGRLHVVFLDVGQGDAIFVETPSGRQMLVDGGPDGAVLLSQLGRHMPFWDRTLDVVVLTHPDSDHITGLLPVLERYRVDVVIFRPVEADCPNLINSGEYDYWLQLLDMEGAEVHHGEAGLQLALDEGLDMAVLHPGAELLEGTNDNSIVARLSYGAVSVLLTGDIEAKVEQRLVRDGTPLASTVLKAAHHGSCTSTTPEFLDAVAPEIVVISVGADNRFGHPCEAVIERLEEVTLYRTDEDGAVEIVTDGTQVWVESVGNSKITTVP